MWVAIYDGESGEFKKDINIFKDTKIALSFLNRGYAVECYEIGKGFEISPISNYQDENIKTDSDGFAMPMKG